MHGRRRQGLFYEPAVGPRRYPPSVSAHVEGTSPTMTSIRGRKTSALMGGSESDCLGGLVMISSRGTGASRRCGSADGRAVGAHASPGALGARSGA